jgi:hypothetical protein
MVKQLEFCELLPSWVTWCVNKPTLVVFSGGTWFNLSGYMNHQNSSFHMLIHEVPLCNFNMRGFLWMQLWLLDHQFLLILHSVINCEHVSHYENAYSSFQQNSATAHTANNSVLCLQSISCGRVASRVLRPPRVLGLSSCDRFLFVGHVKE